MLQQKPNSTPPSKQATLATFFSPTKSQGNAFLAQLRRQEKPVFTHSPTNNKDSPCKTYARKPTDSLTKSRSLDNILSSRTKRKHEDTQQHSPTTTTTTAPHRIKRRKMESSNSTANGLEKRREGEEAHYNPFEFKVTPKKDKKRRGTHVLVHAKQKNQMVLDFGQKGIDGIMCSTCGMFYSPVTPQDEKLHRDWHDTVLGNKAISLKVWKGAKVVQTWFSKGNSKVIMLNTNDPDYKKRTKVLEVRKMVDTVLNFAATDSTPVDEKTYLYLDGGKVVGCAIAERIEQAYRISTNYDNAIKSLVTESKDTSHTEQITDNPLSETRSSDPQTPTKGKSIVHKLDDPQPAIIGISRIWVWKEGRRKGIASKLLDTVRASFLFGDVVDKNLVALSQPTVDGQEFASKYFGRPDFLVYS